MLQQDTDFIYTCLLIILNFFIVASKLLLISHFIYRFINNNIYFCIKIDCTMVRMILNFTLHESKNGWQWWYGTTVLYGCSVYM